MTTNLTIQKLNNTQFNELFNKNALENGQPRTITAISVVFNNLISTNIIIPYNLQPDDTYFFKKISQLVGMFKENFKTY